MGLGAAPHGMGVRGVAGALQTRLQHCGSKLGRETEGLECTLPGPSLCTWGPTVQTTPSC